MPTELELREGRAQVWGEMKALNDQAEQGNRDLDAGETEQWQRLEATLGSFDERIKRQAKLERTPADDREGRKGPIIEAAVWKGLAPTDIRATEEYARAYRKWMALGRIELDVEERQLLGSGQVSLSPGQQRALGVSTSAAGGYLVPDSFRAQLEKAEAFFGGMREVATVIQTDGGEDLAIPVSNDTTNTGRIINENTAATETDPTVGQRIYKAFMYSSDLVRVSLQFLQDSAIDAEGWLADILGERIGRITNTHFTTGVAPNEPSGLAPDSVEGRAGAAGQTTTVIWDDLIFLEHAVNIAYRRGPGVGFMMHDQTLRDIRRLKDGDGRYLWQPGITSGAPNTIDGYPYTVNNDVATMAASARSIFFGKLSKYLIRDVRGITLLRLEERYAESLQVAFLAFSRHDGGLLDAGGNPVQHYANPAT